MQERRANKGPIIDLVLEQDDFWVGDKNMANHCGPEPLAFEKQSVYVDLDGELWLGVGPAGRKVIENRARRGMGISLQRFGGQTQRLLDMDASLERCEFGRLRVDPMWFYRYSAAVDTENLSQAGITADFFNKVGKYPMLSRELEEVVFRRLKAGDSLDILKQDPDFWKKVGEDDRDKFDFMFAESSSLTQFIACANLRLVAYVAKRYKLKMPYLETIQEGIPALYRAVESFDIERGNRFSTYATTCIRNGIISAVGSTREVRLSYKLVTLLDRITIMTARIYTETGEHPTVDELWHEISVEFGPDMRREDFDNLMEAAISGTFIGSVSLDSIIGEDGESFAEYKVQDEASNGIAIAEGVEREDLRARLLALILSTFSQEEAELLDKRFGLTTGRSMTLKEVSHEFNTTRRRVLQLVTKMLQILRDKPEVQRLWRDFLRD